MKQLLIFIGLITICYSFSYSQIYSNTKRVRISNAKEMPPDLRAKFSFEDYNGNNILEALETSKITIIITNIGKGIAENLFITVKDNLRDDNLLIADKMHIAKLYPAQTDTVHINISSTANIKTDKHRLVISVSEENGYDMDPVSLTLTTIEYQKPKLKLVGLKIDENSENSYIKNYDGKVEKGERVKVIMTIQNIGNNIAHDLDFKVTTNDINIKILNVTSHAKVLKVGEVQEVAFSLILNNKIKAVGNLPIFLNATVRHNYGGIQSQQLPIALNQRPPEPHLIDIKPDYNKYNQATFEFSSNTKYSLNRDLSIDTDIPKNKTNKNSYALIIGNSNYSKSDVANLRYTLNDARIFKKYAINIFGVPDNNKHIYYVENINYSGMLKNLKSFKTLIQNSKPQDVFYVYYSGHGAQDADSTSFIIPIDATTTMLNELAIKLEDFYEYLTPPPGKGKVIIFLDACFSGEKLNKAAKVGLRRSAKKIAINSNMLVLAATSGNEISQEYEAKSHGLFTFFLLKALQTAKVNITYEELTNKIIEEVHLTSLNPQNGFVEQKPQAISEKYNNNWKIWKVKEEND